MLIVPSATQATAGAISSWTATTSFSTARFSHYTVTYNGYIYVIGGVNQSLGALNDVQYAPINGDGSVGTWNATTGLPAARYSGAAVAYNGFIYVMGGYGSDAPTHNDVYDAPINADGTLGSWSLITTLSSPRVGFTALVDNGYMYILGGANSSSQYNSVEYAIINNDGTLGSWQSTSSFTDKRYLHSSVIYNGYMYVMGGLDFASFNNSADVQYAPINANGTVGAWSFTTSMPYVLLTFGAVTNNGFLYILGGQNSSVHNGVQYAQFNPDGTIGSWTATASMVNSAYDLTSVVYNGYVYELGGQDNFSNNYNNVGYARFDATPTDRDCDTNSVAYCGAYSPSELISKINNGDGLHTSANLVQIYYTELGYTSTTISNMVDGTMYANGDIYVGATKVATNGRPSGRDRQHVTDTQVGSLWRRADSNFRSGVSTIDVMVNMDGGSFQFAVMKPCGNPVVATPFSTATPTPAANYHPLEPRSATLSKSRTVDPSVHFSWGTTNAAVNKAIRIQTCDSPTSSVTCVKPTGSSMTGVTLTSTGGQLGGSGWSLSVLNDHEVLLTNSTGISTTVGGNSQVDIAGFVNPSFNGTFFFRVTTYSDVAGTANVAYGAIAVSTAQSLTETADVAEALTFRVANSVAADCLSETDVADPNDSGEDLVILSPSTATTSTASIGTAQMCIVSNAGSGFIITYHDAASGGATKGFYDGAHEFPTANNFTSAPGTEQFGFNLRANTVPTVGSEPDGAGLVADLTNSQYSTVNQYSYDDTGSNETLAAKVAPSTAARYTMSFVANISPITPAGTYKAHLIFVATGTF